MNEIIRLRYLRIALIIFGLIFTIGLYPLMYFWHDGFGWEPAQHEYEQMIVGVYFVLGVFLLIAVKNPLNHLSLIWFTSISSFVHATIMLIQALYDKTEHANLMGDVPALFLVAIVLALLTPRRFKA